MMDEPSESKRELPMATSDYDVIRFLRSTLWILFGISLIGVIFSGTLSYRELAGTIASCPAVGSSGAIFGVPACVFGLVIYALLTIIAGFALVRTRPADENRTRAKGVAR